MSNEAPPIDQLKLEIEQLKAENAEFRRTIEREQDFAQSDTKGAGY